MNRICFALSLLLVATAFAAEKKGAEKSPAVGDLVMDVDFPSGCGESVAREKGGKGVVFFSELDSDAATMKLDGKIVKLKRTAHVDKDPFHKMGSVIDSSYEGGDYKVELHKVVSFVCPKDDDACEVTRYDATMSVHKGKTATQFDKLSGDAGC